MNFHPRISNIYHPNNQWQVNKSLYFFIRLLGSFLLSVFFLFLIDSPHAAILLINIIFCLHIAALFRSKYRFLFFIQPLALFTISQLYTTSFLALGDGPSYQAVFAQYIDLTSIFSFENASDFFGFLKNASIGVIPVFILPEFFYGSPPDTVYYLWQGTFHVILCAMSFTIARILKVLPDKYLLAMALFSVISPSFFDLGAAPTRHIVTFNGVLLIFISYIAFTKKPNPTRLTWLLTGVFIVAISKAALLIGVILFFVADQFDLYNFKPKTKDVAFFAAIFLLVFFTVKFAGNYLFGLFGFYSEIKNSGADTFSAYTQVLFLGYLVKYIYAILAPFPWSKAPFFIDTIYGGNWLLFLCHVFSSAIGMYFFLMIFFRAKQILECEKELKQMVIFGSIMSLSILFGTTGFHTYILIYFPFFAPLLLIKQFRINWLYPFLVIFPLEIFVTLNT